MNWGDFKKQIAELDKTTTDDIDVSVFSYTTNQYEGVIEIGLDEDNDIIICTD